MISERFRLFAAAAMGLAAGAAAANPFTLPEPQTLIAPGIYDLHTLIMWIVVGIFVLVFGAMTCAIIRYRKSVGRGAQPFHANTTVEIVWAIIPFCILIGTAYPAIKSTIAMKDNGVMKDGKPGAMVSFKHLPDADIATFHLPAQQLGQQDRRSGQFDRRRIFAEAGTQ